MFSSIVWLTFLLSLRVQNTLSVSVYNEVNTKGLTSGGNTDKYELLKQIQRQLSDDDTEDLTTEQLKEQLRNKRNVDSPDSSSGESSSSEEHNKLTSTTLKTETTTQNLPTTNLPARNITNRTTSSSFAPRNATNSRGLMKKNRGHGKRNSRGHGRKNSRGQGKRNNRGHGKKKSRGLKRKKTGDLLKNNTRTKRNSRTKRNTPTKSNNALDQKQQQTTSEKALTVPPTTAAPKTSTTLSNKDDVRFPTRSFAEDYRPSESYINPSFVAYQPDYRMFMDTYSQMTRRSDLSDMSDPYGVAPVFS